MEWIVWETFSIRLLSWRFAVEIKKKAIEDAWDREEGVKGSDRVSE